VSFGPAHVFYPEATDERCTAALLLDIDPVGLVRGRRPGPSLEPYVNDRPYVASSFLSSAIAEPAQKQIERLVSTKEPAQRSSALSCGGCPR
jgi:hypothetical protein